MRRVLIPIMVLAVSGCGHLTHMNTDTSSRPESNMGSGGRVFYPGEGGPGMTAAQAPPQGTEPGQAPEGDTSMTMLGGYSQEADNEVREREMPIIGPLTVLFGYPFWIFGKSNEEKADHAAKEREANKGDKNAKSRTPDEAERERLQRENVALEKQLQERSQTQAPSEPIRSNGSIADELAMLERRLGDAPTTAAARRPMGAPLGAPRDSIDRNGDGQPDHWVYYDGTRRSRELIDENYDGAADRVLHYDASGALVRSEEDLDGDGRLETVGLHRDGALIRKRSDSNGDGESDSWSFFQGGELARHELDRNSDGFRDLVMMYEQGELVREEEDRNGDGRPDLLTKHSGGQIAEKHEDLDFDGTPDVVSYFKNGKLARRELHSEEAMDEWSNDKSL